jgi:hypothetical protein
MKSTFASRIDSEPEVGSTIGFTRSAFILAFCLKYGGPNVRFWTHYLASAKTQIVRDSGGFLASQEAEWSPFLIPDRRGSETIRSEVEHK